MAPKKDYTPQQMGWAIEAVRKGVKISDAAKKFNVDMSKIKSQNGQNIDSMCQSEFLNTLENKIETTFSSDKMKLFKDLYYKSRLELENILPNKDISLYLVWASSKQILDHDVGNESAPTTSVEKANCLSETDNHNANDSPKEYTTTAVLSHNSNDSEPSISSVNTCLSKEISGLSTSNEPNVGQGDDLPDIDNSIPKSSDKTPIKIANPGTSNYVIPSPFKRNLIWPETDETSKNKKRKLKEKIPFTITSPAWKAYNTKKEEEKRKQIEEKELLAKKLEEKRLEKLSKKKKVSKKQKNTSESSETDNETEIIYAESDESVLSSRQKLSKGKLRNIFIRRATFSWGH